MLPMPISVPVSHLLSHCSKHYASLSHSSSHNSIRAKKVFVRDLFEIVDLGQLVGDCFSDFMEVTVKALLKSKDENKTPKAMPTQSTPAANAPKSQGKKITPQPSTMQDLKKAILDKKFESEVVDSTPVKRLKL